jgi:hypothetical protein
VSAYLILGGCALGAAVLTAWLGRTRRRVLAIGALGVITMAALVFLSLLFAPGSVEEANCHHCAEYFGRWVDPLALIFPALLTVAWCVGVVIGRMIGAFERLGSRS